MVAEEGKEHPLDGTRLQVIIEVCIVRHAYGTGLLADYDHYGIRFLSHTQGSPVSGAEALLDICLFAEGEVTASCHDPSVLDDHGPVMQRGVMVEDSEDQGGGEVCIQLGTTVDDILYAQAARENDECPPPLVDQHITGIEDAVYLVPTGILGPDTKDPASPTPQLGEGTPQLWLVDYADKDGQRN